MDRDTEQYYLNYFDLFNTEGWKQLMVELQQNATAINNIELLKDEADMFYRKGQLNMLANLLNFKDTITNSYEEITSHD